MELAHAEPRCDYGQLTASIAHEVKQPIAATVTNAQAALRWLGCQSPDLEEVRQALTHIVQDGMRAGDVVGRIRDLIKKAPPREDRLEINPVIREVIELTRGEAVKNGVSVQTELAEGLPLIQGDRVQLQQVMLNLIINAVEAISGVSEGSRELLISCGKAGTDDVRVVVRDSGPGSPGAPTSIASSSLSTRPSRAVWGSGSRSVVRSSRRTADGFGRARILPAAPSFNSRCQPTPIALRGACSRNFGVTSSRLPESGSGISRFVSEGQHTRIGSRFYCLDGASSATRRLPSLALRSPSS